MEPADVPHNEQERLRALWRYTARDRRQDPVIEQITTLAAGTFRVPYVLVSLIDEECQWFKSHYGLDVASTPRDISFCAHAILEQGSLEVPDATLDPRFADNPLVTAAPFIRAYLGAPLRTPEGMSIGTLCLIDTQVRRFSAMQRAHLETLATLVMQRFEALRLERLEETVEHARLGLWELDVASDTLWWNALLHRRYGIAHTRLESRGSALALFAEEDRARLDVYIAKAVGEQRRFDGRFQLRRAAAQAPRWLRVTGAPIVGAAGTVRITGTVQDVTRHVNHERSLQQLQLLQQAISRLQQRFIGGHDLSATFEEVLNTLIALTDSESGFLGEVHRDAAGAPYLQAHAITDPRWDPATRERYMASSPEGMQFTRLDTLIGEVMRSEARVISNRVPEDPRRGGLPPGHPPIDTFIGIPVTHRDQLVAVVGLANRAGGYTASDTAALAPFLDSLGQLISSLRLRDQHERAQRRLALAAQVFAESQEAIFFIDEQQRIVEVNDAFVAITGRQRESVLGTLPEFIQRVGGDVKRLDAETLEAWRQQHWRGEAVVEHADGRQVPVHLAFSPAAGRGERPEESADGVYGVGVFSDLTAFKRHAEELYKASHNDQLTGLPNLNALTPMIQRALTERSPHRSVAVGVLDLDGFLQINERLGREAADRVLVEAATALREALGPHGMLARLSGDEFALLCRDHDGSTEVFQRLLHALEALDYDPPVTASLGVTLYPKDKTDPDTLLRHANQAMFRAKGAGGNCLAFFDLDWHQRMQARQSTVTSVAAGLARREFELYFQPQVDIASGRPVGTEALIRWQHPERGLCFPDSFLPALVGSDVELALDAWVLDTALSTLSDWQRDNHPAGHGKISINLTPRSLTDRRFLETLSRALERYPDVPPHLLCIEVLESATLEDIDAATRVMKGCRKLGVSIALDDFGTGYSSLSYLRNLPLDIVKIDKSFVIDMLDDDRDLAIVEGIVMLAQRFGKQVVAEGVESDAHLQHLRALGCDTAQGFGVARPMPASRLLAWWQRQ